MILSSLISFFRNRRERTADAAVQGIMRSMQAAQQARTNQQLATPQAPQNDLLMQFFRGEDNPLIPHKVDDIVTYTDEQMEMYHDFIQWIFPTMRPSQMHPEAPIIDEHFAEQLHTDKTACKNYCRTCQRYLNYMNFDCEGDSHIVDSTREQPFYTLPYHNFLRITRMLESLNQTGHQVCSRAVYEKMFEVMRTAPNHWLPYDDTLRYWKATQQPASSSTPTTTRTSSPPMATMVSPSPSPTKQSGY